MVCIGWIAGCGTCVVILLTENFLRESKFDCGLETI